MEWGTVPAWVTVIVAAVAAGISLLSWRASRRSAQAATRSADASTRSANTAAEALEFQREAARPRVELKVYPAAKHIYRLQNDGKAPAVELAMPFDDAQQIQWAGFNPIGATLAPGESYEFLAAAPANKPSNLRFAWLGQEGWVHVPVP